MHDQTHHNVFSKVLILASIILAIKLVAWFLSGSLAVLTTLIDSTFDVLMSIVNGLAFKYAQKPADDDHRFGHKAIEDITGLFQSLFIFGSGVYVVYSAVYRLIYPTTINHGWLSIALIIVSLGFTLAIYLHQRKAHKATNSTIVHADSLHYLSDFLLNGTVIISLILSIYFDTYFVDLLFALTITAFLIKSAWQIGKNSFDNLMDKEMPDEERLAIIELIAKNKDVKGYHQLKTRKSGNKYFIQMHLELDKGLSLMQAHEIADGLEQQLLEKYKDAEIIIHEDPV